MWKCPYAAVPGISHNQSDFESCEDVVSAECDESFACVCLADGAGSARFARLGASEVVQSTIRLLKEQFDGLFEMDDSSVAKAIVDNCLESIKKSYGESEGFDIRDYSSTLLVVAIHEDRCICAHVGDGIIGRRDDNEVGIISFPWNGEFKNVTVFVTSEDVLSAIDVKKFKLGKETGFFVMSDGTQTSFYSSQKKELISIVGLNQIFDFAITNSVEDTSSFLENNLLNLISKKTSDDCSFGMLVKEEINH